MQFRKAMKSKANRWRSGAILIFIFSQFHYMSHNLRPSRQNKRIPNHYRHGILYTNYLHIHIHNLSSR
jgi:hypothetical protein